jgi:phage terminase large subunit-like protein
LIVGGARSGKTFLFVRSVVVRALRGQASRHAILRFRGNAVRSSIGLDTLPKVMEVCFPHIPLVEHRQEGYFQLPNGSQIWLGGLDDKDRVEKILGQEYATIYFNECSQIPYSSVIIARTRLAQVVSGLKQRAYYDLNPGGTGHWTHREFFDHRDPVSGKPIVDPESFGQTYISPSENSDNLSPEFLRSLETLPEKQRKRFWDGQYVAEVDGALWTYDLIEQCRIDIDDQKARDPKAIVAKNRITRIVVSVDPSGAAGKEDSRSDEIGIFVVGLGEDGNGYLLEDCTLRDGPAVWGRVAANAYHRWEADSVIAEQNFGGEMVRFTIQTADRNVPVKVITASRGKHIRADPVAALYAQGRVKHVGRFPDLEDQLVNFAASGYQGERSPDRADAAIWGLTELMLAGGATGFLDLYRGLSEEKAAKEAKPPDPAPAVSGFLPPT